MKHITPLRILIALGSLAGGFVHLRLYYDGYKDFPDNIGRNFLLNAIASAVAAVVVIVWPNRLAVLAPFAVANATLVGFALSRTDSGFMKFQERGWNPSPDAALSVIIEIATAALAVVILAMGSRESDRHRERDRAVA